MGMMKRRIPSELKSYESQMFFGLTVRQVVCIVCAAVLCVPTFLIVRHYVSIDTLRWLMVLEAAPFAAVGWFKYNDMPLEKMAFKIFGFYSGRRKRKWQFITVETKIHNAEMQLELEQLTKERKQELAEEKKRLKAERKNRRSRKAVKEDKDERE